MAILKNIESGSKIFLHSHHVIGRQENNVDTQLSNPDVSNVHASFYWNGDNWLLKDMSRNGTWLDRIQIHKGADTVINIGQQLNFGSRRNENWIIDDLSGPQPMLHALNESNKNIVLDKIHAIPNEKNPEIILTSNDSEQWYCEQESEYYPLYNGDIISVKNGLQWQIFLPRGIQITTNFVSEQLYQMDDFYFHFKVSRCEEHIFLNIEAPDNNFDMGERVHHYLLLLLARKRKTDQLKGVDESDSGWMYLDELVKVSGLKLSHLNIQIYRAKKQLSTVMTNLLSIPRLFERRRNCIRCEFTQFDEL